MDKVVRIKNGNELEEYLKRNMGLLSQSTMAVHGLSTSLLVDTGESIINNGLKLHGWGGISSTCEILYDENSTDYQDLINYTYKVVDDFGKTFSCNVIVAIPSVLETSDGKKYFLGDISTADMGNSTNEYRKGNNPSKDLPIDTFIDQIKCIPKEFIVGYVICDSNKEAIFRPNKNYIGVLDESKRKKFADDFISEIKYNEIFIGEINPNKIETYEVYMDVYKRFSKNTLYLNQLIDECKKNNKRY